MISVVLYGRNDNYGYNLPKRAALSLNCIAELLTVPTDEILFVDYNTPDDYPTFPEAIRDTLTNRARKMLRIFRVRPSIHARLKSKTRLVVLEPIARNIAVRRSQPSNRWVLSTNTDMIFVLQRLAFLNDVAKDLLPGIYHAPRIEIPEALWEGLDRRAPNEAIKMVRKWGQTLHLDEIVYGAETILYDGPGDFQLIQRSDLFQYNGFHEEMLLGWHVDSNMASRLRLVYGKISDLGDDIRGYHCDHTRQVTPMHSHTRTENDSRRFIRDVDRPDIPEQAQTWGCADDDIEEIRIEQNLSEFYAKGLQGAIGAALERPSVASYTEDTYNKVDYDPRHVIPFLVDMFLASPKNSNIGWCGARAETLRLFSRAWRNCGFTGRILVADPIMGGAVLAELGMALVELSTLLSDSSAFIFDFGGAAGRSDVEADNLNRKIIAGVFQVERHEHRRIDEGNPPRRIIAINAINNDYEQHLIRNVVAAAQTPFSSRLRHGFVLPPRKGREDWLPWIPAGDAGVRIGPVIKNIEGQTGTIAFGGGPYGYVRPGFYLFKINLAVQEVASPSKANEPCVTMEVMYSSAVLGALAIKRGDLKAMEYQISFYLPEHLTWEISGLEARIRTVTPVKIVIDGLTLEPSAQDTKTESETAYALRIGNWLPFLWVGDKGHVDESGIYSKKGDTGYIAYGPYWKLSPGTYEATFTIEKSDEEADINVLGFVDVTVGECKVGARNILACRKNARRAATSTISVPFTITNALAVKSTKTEIRVWSFGVAALRVKAASVRPLSEDPFVLDSKKDWMPLMRIGEAGVRDGDLIKTIEGKRGCIAYGPYEYLRGGSYDLKIEFDELATETRSANETALAIEMWTPTHSLATYAISYNELKKQECRLCFDVPTGISDGLGDIEARIYTMGSGGIRIRTLTVEQTSRPACKAQ